LKKYYIVYSYYFTLMKTILDKTTREELMARISSLNANSNAQWGKMTVYQMLKHCAVWEEMAQGKKLYKQVFLGRLFGKKALSDFIKNDKPVKRNLPTMPNFKMNGDGDVEAEKARWIALLQEYTQTPLNGFMHPFFGKLTADEAGRLAYKHSDHHLRQFGC